MKTDWTLIGLALLALFVIFAGAAQAQVAIGSTTTTPFDSAQRSICRDGHGYIHAVWKYDSTRLVYANSSNNGTTWNYDYYFQGNVSNSTSYKTYPSINCDGNNISVSYEDSTFDDLIVGLSTDNGGSWSWQSIRTSCVASYTDIARRGARIYVGFVTATSSACGYGDGNVSYSTNGGSTWATARAFDGFRILSTLYTYYDRIVVAADGTGTAADKVHTAARYYGNDAGASISGVIYTNSTNGGASYGTNWAELAYGYSPTISFNGTNVYYLTSNLNGVYFNKSTDYGTTWAGEYLNDTVGALAKYSYGSISTNHLGHPLAFWTGNDAGGNFDPAYRNYSGASWDAKVWINVDAVNDNYLTASQYFNPASNCSDAIWLNGTYPNTNISWAAVCYAPAGEPPAGGNATIPVMDIGDPLYCSIPPLVLDSNIEVLCMPKSNTTGQPLTGQTVNCQANANGLYTGGVQAASACGERAAGVYNCTLLASNIAPSTCYTVNCSTAINTVMNGFAGAFCVMPDFSLSSTVTALSANITSVNDTAIAIGSNVTTLATASYSQFANTTAMNNTLGTFITASYSNFNNVTATNNSLASFYGALASNLSAIQTNIATVNNNVIAVGSNLTNHNTTMVAEYGAIASNLTNIQNGITATNNSLTAYYNNLANNLTSINATQNANFGNLASNLTDLNTSLIDLGVNTTLLTDLTAEVGSNLTNTNATRNTQYGMLASNLSTIQTQIAGLDIDGIAMNLTNINMTLIATNNSINSFYNELANNMTSLNATIIGVGNNVTSVNNTVIAVGANLTAYYHAIAANMTSFNTTSFALLAQLGINITSVNGTIIAVGSNQTMNATRVFNILTTIAACMPCPIGGLSGAPSGTLPIPLSLVGQNITAQTPPAPSQLLKYIGLMLIPLGGILFFTYKKAKEKKKKKKEEKKPPNPEKE